MLNLYCLVEALKNEYKTLATLSSIPDNIGQAYSLYCYLKQKLKNILVLLTPKICYLLIKFLSSNCMKS